jgi:hypothetical protein
MLQLGRLQPYTQTLEEARMASQGKNTLAYFEQLLITAVKSFITFPPEEQAEESSG